MAGTNNQTHYVLVHGACLGAWIWYKVKPHLEAAGHRVTPLDMAASGIHNKSIQDVHTFYEYSEPLLEFLGSLEENEKVVLVGHSLGGINLAVAMDKFPEKISVAVFVTAMLPDTIHQPSYVLEKFFASYGEAAWVDSQFLPYGSSEEQQTSVTLGPKFLASMPYHLCPIEDIELAKILSRPGSLFIPDLAKARKFSDDRYGSAARVYIICGEDKLIPKEFQDWMIDNASIKDVMEIKGADHIPMASKPQELCECLVQIAHKYA